MDTPLTANEEFQFDAFSTFFSDGNQQGLNQQKSMETSDLCACMTFVTVKAREDIAGMQKEKGQRSLCYSRKENLRNMTFFWMPRYIT